MSDRNLHCSFCKRSEHQVQKLVAGPDVYICDACTERAHAIIHQGEPPLAADALWRRMTRPLRRFGSRRVGERSSLRAAGHAA